MIQLNGPKIVVILNYVEFGYGAIKGTLAGNKNILCNYHIGSGFLVSVLIKLYLCGHIEICNGGRHPTDKGISLNFQV